MKYITNSFVAQNDDSLALTLKLIRWVLVRFEFETANLNQSR
jgi:hypothetical protein